MKKHLYIVMTGFAIVVFCAFLTFLFDLASFGRISKACSIWEGMFYSYTDTARGAVLMANTDILCILVLLFIFGILVLELFKQYKYWVWMIPIAGSALFFMVGYNLLCFI